MSEGEEHVPADGGYRPELDAYSGPMDLLLYLIRRDEVDIFDIPIARVTNQFIAYLEAMQSLDMDVAGEFLVMAATLMEIKSRMLLPKAEEEGEEEEEEDDPRLDLVRQLIQYRKFREAADRLRERNEEFSLRLGRPEIEIPREMAEIDDSKLLENVTVYDLLDMFTEILKQTRVEGEAVRRIVYDDVPVHVHIRNVRDRLDAEGGQLEFVQFFSPEDSRARVIGIFLALLEMVRLRNIRIRQEAVTGRIIVVKREDSDGAAPAPVPGADAAIPQEPQAPQVSNGEDHSPETEAAEAPPAAADEAKETAPASAEEAEPDEDEPNPAQPPA